MTNASQLSSFLLHCYNQRLTSFSKKSNKVRFFWNTVSIKLNGLKMLKLRCSIVNFLSLVPKVLLNFTLDSTHQNTKITKTLPKKSLNSNQGKGALVAWFQRLCWYKKNKAVTVQLKTVVLTVYIEVILKLLRAFSVACRFGATGFNLKERVHAEFCYCFLIYLAEARVGTGPHTLFGISFLS